MRKIILSITIILCAIASVNAQDSTLVTRKGVRILPKAGDLAIGLDASPFLYYLGNLVKLGGNDNVAPTASFLNGTTIFVKYFTSDKTALRFRFQVENSHTNDKVYTFNDSDPVRIAKTVIDNQTHNVNDYTVALGYEWRRGRTRLQGFYGGEIIYGYSNNNYKYSYANPITQANPTPTTINFNTDLGNDNLGGGNVTGYRVLTDNRGGRSSSYGLGAFIGVEYFFTPAISLGAEVSWNFRYNSFNQTKVTSEIWNGSAVETRTDIISPTTTSFGTGTSNPSLENNPAGHLFLMFHF